MDYGFLALIPPIVAIALALMTKQTIVSLFCGIWLGATIINGWNPFVGFVTTISDFMIPSIADGWNAGLLVLVSLAGGFVYMVKASGAAFALEQVARNGIRSRKTVQTVAWFSSFAFLYTEPTLTLGTIMRPLTDSFNVSRVKLAYILDSMGCNLAAISPVSSYGPFITGLIATQIAALGFSENPWSLYIRMIPYNFYGIFAMLTVLYVIRTGLDIGPMYTAEKRAIETGELYGKNDKLLVPDDKNVLPEGAQITLSNFIVPLGALFVSIFAVIFWSGDIVNNGLRASFLEANIVLAISTGFVIGSIAAGFIGIKSGLLKFDSAVSTWTEGVKQLMIVPIILVLAWSIGGVTDDMGLGDYLIVFVDGYLSPGFVPPLIFLIGSLVAFSTGSSWGVFAIMMPIAIPIANAVGIHIPLAIGAVISGGLFGDHCSPISDTTILSSTGAACDHIEHVRTQIPYALTVGISAFIGFLAAGITGIPFMGVVVTAAAIASSLFLLHQHAAKKELTGKRDTKVAER